MPWYNGDFPPSYKNQPVAIRNKAVEIANELLAQGLEEGVAIATGLKRARIFFRKKSAGTGQDDQNARQTKGNETKGKTNSKTAGVKKSKRDLPG